MSDDANNKSKSIECPADRDPAVRLLIAAGLCVAGIVYCLLTPEPKPEGPLATKTANEYAKWWLYIYGPWVLGVLTVFLAGYAAMVLRRRIVADDEAITINRKRRVAWSQFVGLDAAELKDKGRLTLRVADGDDVVLDRYKYKNFKELVALVEKKVSASPGAGPAEADEADGGEG
jgi:hypothetical protein